MDSRGGRRRGVGAGLALAALLGSGAVACAGTSSHTATVAPASAGPATADPTAGHAVTDPVYLDRDTLFAPPPEGRTPTLDAREAFDAFAHDDRAIPDGMQYQLGLLTVPPSVTDILVWGYHLPTPGVCVRTGLVRPPSAGPAPSPTDPPQCISWDFINADTGHFVQGMSQVVSGPGADLPTPTPPAGTDELARGGPLPPNLERFSPDALVVQAPLSTIRWTFDMAHCDIELHWFQPPGDATSEPGAGPCRLAGVFSVDATAGFTSRGGVFAVVAGHIAGAFDSPRDLVRVVLANGDTETFDPDEDNRAWLFPIQRCGDFAGTVPVAVEEVKYDLETVIDRRPVPPTAFDRQSPSDCDA